MNETPINRALRQMQYDFDRGKRTSFIMICDTTVFTELKNMGYRWIEHHGGLTEISQ